MVRRANRTVSAIERGFQTLEAREAQARKFFAPLSDQELARLEETGSLSVTGRHRYADVLQWTDDVSAILGADDPTVMERLQRRQARATSALMRARAAQLGPTSVAASVRPSSAPPGFDPVSIGSALQAALQGALDAAHSPATSLPPSKGFESRLIDEYLRAQSLRPDAPAGSSSNSGTGGAAAAESRGAGRADGGTLEGAGVRASGGLQEADLSALPHIDEGVEDVDEGMDGEEFVLSPDARLMYYGHTKPRSHSRSRGSSPRHSAEASPVRERGQQSPGRSGSPAGTRNRSWSPPAMRPGSAAATGSSRLSSSPPQQRQQQQFPSSSDHALPRPFSAAPMSGQQQLSQQQQQQRPRPLSSGLPPRPQSAAPVSPSHASPSATLHIPPHSRLMRTSPSQSHSATAAAPPASPTASTSPASASHPHSAARPWSASPYMTSAASPSSSSAAPVAMRRSFSASPASPRHLTVTAHALQLGPQRAPVKRQGPSNGFVTRNPAGPPVATFRAARPMSAAAAVGAQREGAGDRPKAAAAQQQQRQRQRPASAAAVPAGGACGHSTAQQQQQQHVPTAVWPFVAQAARDGYDDLVAHHEAALQRARQAASARMGALRRER